MSRNDNVLPLFEAKELVVEYKSSRESREWDEGTQKIIGLLLLAPAAIVLSLILGGGLQLLIPGFNEFTEENKWVSMLMLLPVFIGSYFIMKPLMERIEEKKQERVSVARAADAARYAEAVRVKGYTVPEGARPSDTSRIVYTSIETGVEYRAVAGHYNGTGYTMVLSAE